MTPSGPVSGKPDSRSNLLHEMVGYLNLSSGTPDSQFQRNLNCLYAHWEQGQGDAEPWHRVGESLRSAIAEVRGTSAAFAEMQQAEGVVQAVWDHLLPAYRQFHRDLLQHLSDGELFRPFWLARAVEAVLQQGPPWNETSRLVESALRQLNDFIGHRPVAVLHNEQRMEPYAHEWVRPIPLYIAGAGVACGRFAEVIEAALPLLRNTDEDLLRAAMFDPDLLDELAVDPRAYDFNHPANRRVNYQFGQWDPHHIDLQGRYRRFVVTDVVLAAISERIAATPDVPHDELVFEGAAVLAGTMLMASGVSGWGPAAHDSSVSLSNLLPRIVEYRDAFYQRLLQRMTGPHAQRLRQEAEARQQPFAAARQHLNQQLARWRAAQQQQEYLAHIFASMGFPEASRRQVEGIAAVSARMKCALDGHLTSGSVALDRGQLAEACRHAQAAEELLHRGIECGALVDPWNILGFAGMFPLFPSPENSIRDHRVATLIRTMDRLFSLQARIMSEAAAVGDEPTQQQLQRRMRKLAQWWDQFATTEVSDVGGFSGSQACDSAIHVAQALGAWHRAGAAAGDLGFWRQHVAHFQSGKAYALVVDALLEQGDLRASMALMMNWLSQVDAVPLEQSDYSLPAAALRWMRAATAADAHLAERWPMVCKFFDYLEANAEDYWHVPQFAPQSEAGARSRGDGTAADDQTDELLPDELLPDDEAAEEESDNPFAAAYEQVVYHDSTRDGIDADMLEGRGATSDFELKGESRRVNQRLTFLATLAELYSMAAAMALRVGGDQREQLQAWFATAQRNRRELERLLAEVHRYPIPEPSGTHESLIEYDERQTTKEILLESIMGTSVAMSAAARSLLVALGDAAPAVELSAWEQHGTAVLQALVQRDAQRTRKCLAQFMEAARSQPLLYLPRVKGGDPRRIVATRTLQQLLGELLAGLPRLGLLRETCELVELARHMENEHPQGHGAVSEFDRLFTTAYRALVEAVVEAAGCGTPRRRTSRPAPGQASAPRRSRARREAELVEVLNLLTEKLLRSWLAHSSSLRLSVVETFLDERPWREVVQFVKDYGRDLFSPLFLNEGNLRAILHQGTENYLHALLRLPEEDCSLHLVAQLRSGLPIGPAARCLERIVQAVVENYAEYNDYNHTTTQSDRGDMLDCFLDFLRIKATYERMAWNIKPVILAHEVLVRRGCERAARRWLESMTEQTAAMADQHWQRYLRLVERYGMRLPTVADLLQERFVRPLHIDRARALIAAVIEEGQRGGECPTLHKLEREIEALGRQPTGVGLDVPNWLLDLEEEVAHALPDKPHSGLQSPGASLVAWEPLTLDDVLQQLEGWNADDA
jgi:hypothetical protein